MHNCAAHDARLHRLYSSAYNVHIYTLKMEYDDDVDGEGVCPEGELPCNRMRSALRCAMCCKMHRCLVSQRESMRRPNVVALVPDAGFWPRRDSQQTWWYTDRAYVYVYINILSRA